MTTTNINKIVRSNINIKPWLLSRNTSEIVSTYIKKLYKQNSFRPQPDLLKAEIPKLENKGPLRALKSRERSRHSINVRNKTNLNQHHDLLDAVMLRNRRNGLPNLVNNKKMLKTPNYKIYGSRRYGSSASSSSASIFRRYEDRRRQRTALLHQQPTLLPLARNLGTATTPSNYATNRNVAKFLVPVRNQHMTTYAQTHPCALHVNSAIQRDLMSIDSTLKDRISLSRTKQNKHKGDNKIKKDPLNGWNHPPPPDFFMPRYDERSIASAELHEQHRRLKIATVKKHTTFVRQFDTKTELLSGFTTRKINRQRIDDPFERSLSPVRAPHFVKQKPVTVSATFTRRLRRHQQAPAQINQVPQSQAQIQALAQKQAQMQAHILNVMHPQMAKATPSPQQPTTQSSMSTRRYSQSSWHSSNEVKSKTTDDSHQEEEPSEAGAEDHLVSPPASATSVVVAAAATITNQQPSIPYHMSRYNRYNYHLRRY